MSRPRQTHHAVVRLEWQVSEDGSWLPEGDPTAPVKVFPDRRDAENHARELERAARATLTPFRLSPDPEQLTRREEEELTAALRAIGLPNPAGYGAEWWEEHVAPLSEDAQQVVWDVFDRVRFYRVVEVVVEE